MSSGHRSCGKWSVMNSFYFGALWSSAVIGSQLAWKASVRKRIRGSSPFCFAICGTQSASTCRVPRNSRSKCLSSLIGQSIRFMPERLQVRSLLETPIYSSTAQIWIERRPVYSALRAAYGGCALAWLFGAQRRRLRVQAPLELP